MITCNRTVVNQNNTVTQGDTAAVTVSDLVFRNAATVHGEVTTVDTDCTAVQAGRVMIDGSAVEGDTAVAHTDGTAVLSCSVVGELRSICINGANVQNSGRIRFINIDIDTTTGTCRGSIVLKRAAQQVDSYIVRATVSSVTVGVNIHTTAGIDSRVTNNCATGHLNGNIAGEVFNAQGNTTTAKAGSICASFRGAANGTAGHFKVAAVDGDTAAILVCGVAGNCAAVQVNMTTAHTDGTAIDNGGIICKCRAICASLANLHNGRGFGFCNLNIDTAAGAGWVAFIISTASGFVADKATALQIDNDIVRVIFRASIGTGVNVDTAAGVRCCVVGNETAGHFKGNISVFTVKAK